MFGDLFGDPTDAIDAAGDAEQARIIQAIDLFNERFEQANQEMFAGKEEYVAKLKETLNKVRDEIKAGNLEVAETLRQGLDGTVEALGTTYDVSKRDLIDGWNLAKQSLDEGQASALSSLSTGYNAARSDVTTGRDNALGTLRSSLSNSLDAIANGSSKASQAVNSALQQTRQNYAPYIAAGEKSIARSEQLTNDPNAQLDYVQNNPFFSAMQETARDQLFSNQAARGRIGSGETLDQLDKNTLLLGEQLVGNAIGRNNEIAGMGLNAATNQSAAEMNGGSLLAQIAQNAAGQEVGAETNFGNNASAIESGSGNFLAQLATRFGEGSAGIEQDTAKMLGEIAANYGGQMSNISANLGTQMTNATGGYWSNLANLMGNENSTLAGLTQAAGLGEADANKNRRDTYANMIMDGTSAVIPLLMALGNSEANEEIGEQAAGRQQFNDLLSLASVAMTGFDLFRGGSTQPSGGGGYSGYSGPSGYGGSVPYAGGGGPFTMGNTFPSITTSFQPTQPMQFTPFSFGK